MSRPLQWILGLSAVLVVAAIVFSAVAPYVLPGRAVTAYGGMMGPGFEGMMGQGLPGMMGPGHMVGGFGVRMPFFGLMGLVMFGAPLLLIGLAVFGLAALLRRPRPDAPAAQVLPSAPVATAACAHCGQPLQPGWKACPNCGEKV